MPSRKPLANRDFLKRVRDYLPMDTAVWKLDEAGKACSRASADELEDNTFYGLDAEAMVAASHAVEDLALDEANGFLLASFQDSKRFEPQRERYWQLAATIDEVHVVAIGKKPRRQRGLKFFCANGTGLASFWVVLYQGRRAQAMVIGRQTNDAPIIEERRFAGCYTFDLPVIARVRRDLEEVLAGRTAVLREYERLLAIDKAAKQINLEFTRQQQSLEAALNQWQVSGDPHQLQHLMADLDGTLDRFRQIKEWMSTVLTQTGTPT